MEKCLVNNNCYYFLCYKTFLGDPNIETIFLYNLTFLNIYYIYKHSEKKTLIKPKCIQVYNLLNIFLWKNLRFPLLTPRKGIINIFINDIYILYQNS